MIKEAYAIGQTKPEVKPLVYARVGKDFTEKF